MKSSWMDYVAFNSTTFAVVNSEEKSWKKLYFDLGSLVLDNGKHVDLADPGLRSLFRAISFHGVGEDSLISDFRAKLGSWNANYNKKGPGQYDMSLIRDLRETCDQHGWAGVDTLMDTLYSAVPSRAFAEPRCHIDSSDPSVDGDDCYSLVLSVKAPTDMPNVHADFADKWRALGSTSNFVINHLVALVDGHYANATSNNRVGQATRTADLADSGIPYKVSIMRNGIESASVRLAPKPDGAGIDIRWATARMEINDLALMKALAAIVPAQEAHRFKGKFVQDELGL